jgi:hypothetical protein
MIALEKSKNCNLKVLKTMSFSDFVLFQCSLLITFCRNIFLSLITSLEHKENSAFLDTKGIFLVSQMRIFSNFESICSKNGTFSNILHKRKTYLLRISISLSLNPNKFGKSKAYIALLLTIPNLLVRKFNFSLISYDHRF